jgi:SAM-dependent methyltransferase
MEPNKIDAKNDSADLVIMITLHHELDKPELMLKEIYRVLKPGGKIVIIDWKKIDMEQGPSIQLRCKPEDIHNQLQSAEFKNITLSVTWPKHFMLIAEK